MSATSTYGFKKKTHDLLSYPWRVASYWFFHAGWVKAFLGGLAGAFLLAWEYSLYFNCGPSISFAESTVLQRAKRELLDAGLLFETVMGQRSNKAGWYAVTWYALDRHTGYDTGALESFKRGAYRDAGSAPENARLSPPGGTGAVVTVPSPGPIRGLSRPFSVPSDGHHLDNHLLQCSPSG